MDSNYYFEKIDITNYSDYLEVIESIKYICKYSGFDESNINLLEEIRNQQLPQGGLLENNFIIGLKVTYTNEAIAWIQYYENFQNHQTVFLGELYIKKEKQNRKIGTMILTALEEEWKMKGFHKIVLNVDLKNWAGIRFWVKNGFKTIENVMGSYEYSENSFANMRLCKFL